MSYCIERRPTELPGKVHFWRALPVARMSASPKTGRYAFGRPFTCPAIARKATLPEKPGNIP